MDKFIHTVLNSVQNLYDNRSVQAQNLANLSVPGYRKDISVKPTASVFLDLDGSLASRAFSVREDRNQFSDEQGSVDRTDSELDVAIRGIGYMYGSAGGDPFLTRRGDLALDSNGMLINGAGEKILDTELQPINVPPARKITINGEGQIIITPLGAEDGVEQQVAVLGLTSAAGAKLKKSDDGSVRQIDGGLPVPDQQVTLVQGFIELANVNVVDELVNQIENQRHYEINIKMISTGKDLDEAGSSLLRMPS